MLYRITREISCALLLPLTLFNGFCQLIDHLPAEGILGSGPFQTDNADGI